MYFEYLFLVFLIVSNCFSDIENVVSFTAVGDIMLSRNITLMV